MAQHQTTFQFLREPQVAAMTGLSKSTRWRLEKAGKFPKRRRLSARSIGWLFSEIKNWVRTRNAAEAGSIA
jgi:prophage regulatory protein